MAQTMTALYSTRGAAEAARDGLIAMNIPESDISIRGNDAASGTAATGSTGEGGFWENLFESFIPESERDSYLEGMRRGGYLVAVQVPDGREQEVQDVLERLDPMDLDEHADNWRKEAGSNWTSTTGATPVGSGTSPVRAAEAMGGAPVMSATDLTEGGGLGMSGASNAGFGTSRDLAASPALDPATSPITSTGDTALDTESTGGDLGNPDAGRFSANRSPTGGSPHGGSPTGEGPVRARVRTYTITRPQNY